MNRAIFATLVLVLGTISSAWAARTIEQVEDAYELVLGEVSLPQRVTGTVSFRTCPTCTRTALRVTNETTYVVNGAALEGDVRTSLEQRGKPLGAHDMLIAAHALSLSLILVTDNEREFKQVKSLAIENWRRE